MNPTQTNVAIARALGLDPSRISKNGVRITLADIGPIVDVTYFAGADDDERWEKDGEFVTELKRYKLVPLDESDDGLCPST